MLVFQVNPQKLVVSVFWYILSEDRSLLSLFAFIGHYVFILTRVNLWSAHVFSRYYSRMVLVFFLGQKNV